MPSNRLMASSNVAPCNCSSNSFSSAAITSLLDFAWEPGSHLQSFLPSSTNDSRMDAEALSQMPVKDILFCTLVVAASFMAASNWCHIPLVVFSGVHKFSDCKYDQFGLKIV
jgi:hypothetical protein